MITVIGELLESADVAVVLVRFIRTVSNPITAFVVGQADAVGTLELIARALNSMTMITTIRMTTKV